MYMNACIITLLVFISSPQSLKICCPLSSLQSELSLSLNLSSSELCNLMTTHEAPTSPLHFKPNLASKFLTHNLLDSPLCVFQRYHQAESSLRVSHLTNPQIITEAGGTNQKSTQAQPIRKKGSNLSLRNVSQILAFPPHHQPLVSISLIRNSASALGNLYTSVLWASIQPALDPASRIIF